MNRDDKGLLETISAWQGEIIIYGAGIWGNKIFDLLAFEKIAVTYFAVSHKPCGDNQSEIKGVEIKEISELVKQRKSALIILAGNQEMRIEAEKTAKDFGFNNILTISKESYSMDMLSASGQRVCLVCGATIKFYNSFGNPPRHNAQCPICDSLERHRALWRLMQKEKILDGRKKVLHFAPERCLLEKILEYKELDYYPVDLDKNMYGIRESVDITNIPYERGMFDVIICSHVLEHIENERKALSELARVLVDAGVAFINTPMHGFSTTIENPAYNTPELRRKYYGQADHVRMYGQDLQDRLEQEFMVEAIKCNQELSEELLARFGLWQDEIVYLCRKK